MKWRLPEVARRRLWDRPARFGAEDDRTPDERRRDNEELLRTLPAVLKPEVFRRVSQLLTVDGRITADGNAIALLEAGLDPAAFLDRNRASLGIPPDARGSI